MTKISSVEGLKNRNIHQANPDENLAIRKHYENEITIPPFMLADLGWLPDTDYRVDVERIPDPRKTDDTVFRKPRVRAPVLRKGDGTLHLRDRNYSSNEGINIVLRIPDDHPTWPFEAGQNLALYKRGDSISFHEVVGQDERLLKAYRIANHQPHGEDVLDQYEEVTGLDARDIFEPAAFKNIWFTDDWLFAVVSNMTRYNHEDRLTIPGPLFALTPFVVDDVVGLAHHPADDYPCWYITPPGNGDYTAKFIHSDTTRFLAKELPFESDNVHVTYDPEGDTLVFYEEDASPFTDPRDP